MPARAAEIAIASAAGLAVGYLCTAAPSQIPAGQGRYDVRCKLDIKAINAQIVANETQYAANVGKPSALPCAATQDFTYTCTPFTEGTALTEWQKVVHFLRHAQGDHNKAVATEGEQAYQNWAWRDSSLTPEGKLQSAAVVADTSKLDLETVLVSPLSRTLQTAYIGMPTHKTKMVADELCRERVGLNPCDFRRDVSEIKSEFQEMDFSKIPEKVSSGLLHPPPTDRPFVLYRAAQNCWTRPAG